MGDLWSSKYVPYSGLEEIVDTRPTGDCRCWRIGVGTLVPVRCLGWGTRVTGRRRGI